MVVAEGERAEAAEEIEDPAAVLVEVEHALGALDLHLVEAEQLHEMQLARVDVRLEEVGHASDVERLGVIDGHEVRLRRRLRRERSARRRTGARRRRRAWSSWSSTRSYSAGTWQRRPAWPLLLGAVFV